MGSDKKITQKIRRSPFFTYVRNKSPRILISKSLKNLKDVDPNQPSGPSSHFTEASNELVAKLFHSEKKTPAIARGIIEEKEEDYGICIHKENLDRKRFETTTPKQTHRLMSHIKSGMEFVRDKSAEGLAVSLKISTIKSPMKEALNKQGNQDVGLNKDLCSRRYNTNVELDNSDDDSSKKFNRESLNIKFNLETELKPGKENNTSKDEQKETEDCEEDMERKPRGLIKEGSQGSQAAKVVPTRKVAINSKTIIETGAKTGLIANPKKIVKSNTIAPKQPENVDVAYSKKLEAMREFSARMNYSFNLQIKPSLEKPFTPYKYYIGKGNNHMLIRALMKTRWWWAQTDSKNPKEINFQWTQWRNKKFIESLPPMETPWSEEGKRTDDTNLKTKQASSEEGAVSTISENKEIVDDAVKDEKNVEQSSSSGHPMSLVAESFKRLFTRRELEVMNQNSEAFKNGLNPKEYKELCKQKSGPKFAEVVDPSSKRICNHIEDNFHLANKKALLVNMKSYFPTINEDVFRYLPLTFHIKNGLEDEEYKRFLECYKQREKEIQEQETEDKSKSTKKARNIWIVKPGEDTNKGKGISLVNDLNEIKDLISGTKTTKASRTLLIQLYLDRPLLYNKRKFDIRCYMLVSCINGVYKGNLQ